MAPLLFIALGAGALFLYERHKHQSASGITPGNIGSSSTVKGKSGETWTVNMLPADAGSELAEVIYKSGSVPAQPHMVIRYIQLGSDTSKRYLAATGQTTPGLIQSAVADFGIDTGPTSKALAQAVSALGPTVGTGTPSFKKDSGGNVWLVMTFPNTGSPNTVAIAAAASKRADGKIMTETNTPAVAYVQDNSDGSRHEVAVFPGLDDANVVRSMWNLPSV